MSERRSAESEATYVKRCANLDAHGPHDWSGFPPDVWRCVGRAWLTDADMEMLSEAFGGSTPSSLLLTRVERIVAAHIGRALSGRHPTEPTAPAEARESVEELLAAHAVIGMTSLEGELRCRCDRIWRTNAAHRAHVASLLAEREAEVVRETLLAAADEVHREARWQQENVQRELLKPERLPRTYTVERLVVVERILRARADARDRGGMGGGGV